MRRRFDVFWDSLFRKYKDREELEKHFASLELTTYRIRKAKRDIVLLLDLMNQEIENEKKDVFTTGRSTHNIFKYHSKFVNNLFDCLANHNKYLQQGTLKGIYIPHTLFHGTTTRFLPNITKQGLLLCKAGQCWEEDKDKKLKKVCLTDSLYSAEFFALFAAQKFGGRAVVLRVNIRGLEDKRYIIREIFEDDDSTVFDGYFEFFFTDPIPPSRIKIWCVLPKPSACELLAYWIECSNLSESSKEEEHCQLETNLVVKI